jgi:hypothetical protein
MKTNIKTAELLEQLQGRIDVVRSQSDINSGQIDFIIDCIVNLREETREDEKNLVNLQEMTQQAFTAVSNDVDTINSRCQQIIDASAFLSTRVTALENAPVAINPAPEPCLPFDHTWVNRKLSGVYEYIEELESKIQKLESRVDLAEDVDKAFKFHRDLSGNMETRKMTQSDFNAMPLVTSGWFEVPKGTIDFKYGIQEPKPLRASYMGFDIIFKGNRMLLENLDEFEMFYIGGPSTEIIAVENRYGNLIIDTANKDQYALCGGPKLVTMFIILLARS